MGRRQVDFNGPRFSRMFQYGLEGNRQPRPIRRHGHELYVQFCQCLQPAHWEVGHRQRREYGRYVW